MRLFISGSQQCSAAAPNRLFANYSVNVIHYDLPSSVSESLRFEHTAEYFVFLFFCWGEAFWVFDMVKDIPLSSIYATEQSETDLHWEGVCFLAIMFSKIPEPNVQWPLIVLCGVHVISGVVSCVLCMSSGGNEGAIALFTMQHSAGAEEGRHTHTQGL